MDHFDSEMSRERANRPILSPGERILWEGKPKKSAFIASNSLTLLPLAVFWFYFDSSMLMSIFQAEELRLFLLLFFAVHLMPVWIWLGSTISAFRRWKNTDYYITTRRVIFRSGFWAVNERSMFYKDIHSVQIKVTIFDKVFKTGTICFNAEMVTDRRTMPPAFQHLSDYEIAYDRIQRTVMDIQTDIAYPNAYRPAHNPGYHTDYDN